MDLLLVKLIFTLRLESELHDPQALLLLNKPFEEAFRKSACRYVGRCDQCTCRDVCTYHAVFAQELAADPSVVKRYQKPPLPFAFQIPLPAPHSKRGDEFELGLVLVGRTAGLVKIFREAVVRLFRPDKPGAVPSASIVRVESAGCSGFRSLLATGEGIPSPAGLVTISLDDLIAMNTLPSDRVGIRIHTPLRTLSDGKPVTEFSFSSFIRPLLRRISSLSYYYYGSILDMDYKRLTGISGSIETHKCDFRWVNRHKGSPCGIVGTGTLVGDLTDFHPALLLGEYLQCGKGAAFGMGRYELVRI
jgi:hypothetical protein